MSKGSVVGSTLMIVLCIVALCAGIDGVLRSDSIDKWYEFVNGMLFTVNVYLLVYHIKKIWKSDMK